MKALFFAIFLGATSAQALTCDVKPFIGTYKAVSRVCVDHGKTVKSVSESALAIATLTIEPAEGSIEGHIYSVYLNTPANNGKFGPATVLYPHAPSIFACTATKLGVKFDTAYEKPSEFYSTILQLSGSHPSFKESFYPDASEICTSQLKKMN